VVRGFIAHQPPIGGARAERAIGASLPDRA
jgi:hypothetical protein